MDFSTVIHQAHWIVYNDENNVYINDNLQMVFACLIYMS